jgi:hypothetical protein
VQLLQKSLAERVVVAPAQGAPSRYFELVRHSLVSSDHCRQLWALHAERFAGWKDLFDRFPFADSPGYHRFRHWFGWEPVAREKNPGLPAWKIADLRDPCEELV